MPTDYGFRELRHSAPSRSAIVEFAAVFSLDVPAWAGEADAVLDIDWAGDVAEIRVDGHTVDDRFWDGERWSVSVQDAGIRPGSAVTLHVLPLSPHTTIGLPAAARARIGTEQLCALDAVVVRERGIWRQVDPT